jgi:hypothetical protein
MSRYQKGEFLLTPNKSNLRGQEPAVQVVFIWLAEHSDDNDVSYPSRTTLAAECGISVRTLDRAMLKLVELGLIMKKPRFNENKQTSNLYQVLIKEQGGDKSAPLVDKTHLGATNLHGGGDKSAHRTNPIELNIDTKVSMGAEAPSEFGSSEINELLNFWAMTTQKPIQRQVKRNRQACSTLLKLVGSDGLSALVQTVAQNKGTQFFPIITDFISLEFKLDQVEAWRLRNSPAPTAYPNVAAQLYPEKYRA